MPWASSHNSLLPTAGPDRVTAEIVQPVKSEASGWFSLVLLFVQVLAWYLGRDESWILRGLPARPACGRGAARGGAGQTVGAGSAERSCVCVCMMVHGAAPKHVKAWRIFAHDCACWGNVGGCWGMSGDV